jgi:hypothetical protein
MFAHGGSSRNGRLGPCGSARPGRSQEQVWPLRDIDCDPSRIVAREFCSRSTARLNLKINKVPARRGVDDRAFDRDQKEVDRPLSGHPIRRASGYYKGIAKALNLLSDTRFIVRHCARSHHNGRLCQHALIVGDAKHQSLNGARAWLEISLNDLHFGRHNVP